MINAGNSKIVTLRDKHIGLETLLVYAVATRTGQDTSNGCSGARGIVRQGHGGPKLLNQRIHSETAGVAGGCSARPTIGSGIQIVLNATESENSGSHCCSRDGPLNGYDVVVPAEALVVCKEVGLTPKNLFGNYGAADSATEAIVMEAGKCGAAGIVIPSVGVKIVVEIILVESAVPCI